MLELDALDRHAATVFEGQLVRKPPVPQVRPPIPVPA